MSTKYPFSQFLNFCPTTKTGPDIAVFSKGGDDPIIVAIFHFRDLLIVASLIRIVSMAKKVKINYRGASIIM